MGFGLGKGGGGGEVEVLLKWKGRGGCRARREKGYRNGKGGKTHVAKTGACSCTLNVLSVFPVATTSRKGASERISHSLTSPFLLPDTSSRRPPRCMCTFVIHCLCWRQTFTMAKAGLRRWSKTRTAPSPYPAQKTLPATWSEVSEVMQEPERAGMSWGLISWCQVGCLRVEGVDLHLRISLLRHSTP